MREERITSHPIERSHVLTMMSVLSGYTPEALHNYEPPLEDMDLVMARLFGPEAVGLDDSY